MKRIFVAFGLIALFALVPLAADTSDFYPVKVQVVKILAHAEGFQVIYNKGSSDTAVVNLSISWFVPGGKAELVRAVDPAYPYLVVFYKQGKFDHLRLYAQMSYSDPSWGVLNSAEGNGKFDVKDIVLQF
jgi:hypothetical protein